MIVNIYKNSEMLGQAAAKYCAEILNAAIAEKGEARLVLSTGASQFDTLKHLVQMNVDWSRVEMFHLDEYIGIPETHPASFRKYLKDRFTSLVKLKAAYFVNTEGDVNKSIEHLTEELRKKPVDLALIGIGENGHIAFNDPPADFETREAFIVVDLDERCKRQQVREGWFPTVEDVPKQAVTMTCYQIMQSRVIVSCVPYKVKAEAIKLTLGSDATNEIPATILKNHDKWMLFLDEDSASLVSSEVLRNLTIKFG
ncbi:MAG: glucosamine-6-phosphate deaminase [Clostridiales bacterium]|jgi:glucosamine-6-phosphate deaminase|nr:glucosamine-6-phosphate deaminase [Clostridiales bacterium]